METDSTPSPSPTHILSSLSFNFLSHSLFSQESPPSWLCQVISTLGVLLSPLPLPSTPCFISAKTFHDVVKLATPFVRIRIASSLFSRLLHFFFSSSSRCSTRQWLRPLSALVSAPYSVREASLPSFVGTTMVFHTRGHGFNSQ